MDAATVLSVLAGQQAPEDVGKAGPIGLLLTVLLAIAIWLLVKSMTKHLKRIPPSFDDEPTGVPVPDSPAGLLEPQPGQQVLDDLRRAPRAIEPPRTDRGDGAGS